MCRIYLNVLSAPDISNKKLASPPLPLIIFNIFLSDGGSSIITSIGPPLNCGLDTDINLNVSKKILVNEYEIGLDGINNALFAGLTILIIYCDTSRFV